jgi:hypothetical protein
MRDNEKGQHPSRSLAIAEFSTLESPGIKTPGGQEKYNNT